MIAGAVLFIMPACNSDKTYGHGEGDTTNVLQTHSVTEGESTRGDGHSTNDGTTDTANVKSRSINTDSTTSHTR